MQRVALLNARPGTHINVAGVCWTHSLGVPGSRNHGVLFTYQVLSLVGTLSTMNILVDSSQNRSRPKWSKFNHFLGECVLFGYFSQLATYTWVVRCWPKTRCRKDMCLKAIALCGQVFKIILGSIFITIGGLGGCFKVLVILTLINRTLNMRDWCNPWIVTIISYHIRGSK